MTLKPLQDRVVAKKETPAEKTASGFFMPGDKIDNQEYLIVKEEDILATIN